MCIYIYIYTYVHICMYIYIYIYNNTNSNTYKCPLIRRCSPTATEPAAQVY